MSYAGVKGYGRVGANGLIYFVGGEAILLGTPWNDSLTKQLVNWITDHLRVHVGLGLDRPWHLRAGN